MAPYLFDLKGQTTLRTTTPGYIPQRPLAAPLDWDAVRRDYDYVWLYGYPEFTAQLASSKLAYAAGNLRVYQVGGAAPKETAGAR